MAAVATLEKLSQAKNPKLALINEVGDLSRQRGGLQTSPVVFTAGVDLPGGDLFSERIRRVFGPMVHTVSQGPGWRWMRRWRRWTRCARR